MIKATIQRTPYCTEMTFPCTETQLSTWLDELRMNPEHLCPAATITQIEPAELSILEDCEVSLDALNYLAKRMDGMSRAEQNQFFAALTCEELDIGWGMKNIINLTFNLDRFTLVEDTSDLEKVGLTHQLNIRGAIPASELEDREWLIEDGKKLLDSGKGIQTEYGLLFVNREIEFEDFYNGTTFPGYFCDPDAIANVGIFYHGITEYVELPCEDIAIKKAKEVYYDDIKRIDTEKMPNFDLFVGGFPCQSFSASGAGRGFADPRGALFFELARIIKDKRPAAFLLENVPRLISHDSFRTFQTILCTLSKMGYCLEWMVFNSAAFNLAQSRERVYIVGHRRPERAGKVFPVEYGDHKAPVEIIGGSQGSRVYSAEGTAITQCAGGSGGGAKTGIYFFDMNPDFDFTENARCLLARYDSGVSNHKGVNSGVFIEGDFPGAIRFVDKNGVPRIGILRKLMPLESWRLQGFSDEQFNKVAALGMRDGQLYKMAGNAVSVPVIKAIGEKIRDIIFDEG